MLRLLFIVFILSFFSACNHDQGKKELIIIDEVVEIPLVIKNHSYSNVEEIYTEHLDLNLLVDFNRKVIDGVARHKMNNSGVNRVIFDIKGLQIEKVTLGENERPTKFKIGDYHSIFGAPLIIDIDETTEYVTIYFSTSADADAIDWLDADMTRSGNYPFLYTQGEAILTRSWIPIQDVPANRFTYSAHVKVPKGMMALMSATNPQELSEDGEYSFEMDQPISSYLLALAVGELEFIPLDERTGIYAEPEIIESAAKEFKVVPEMIAAAERLYGEYQWGRYDVLFLPASFPFGGMENPRLTFATPTIIAGDGSLANLIAHELAHSWSGNLVTNASWEDFWLNEGFTVYFENRIMEEVAGKETSDMLFYIEYQELMNTLQTMNANREENDTKLKLELEDRDPDDAMTDIAYFKGALFLATLEHEVGRERFDEFVAGYFKSHEYQTITTEEFIKYLNDSLLVKDSIDFNYEEWIYGKGIPENAFVVRSKKLEKMQELASNVKKGRMIPKRTKRSDNSTFEWVAFIRAFDGKLAADTMRMIDKQLHFKDCGNAEIMTEWYLVAIQNDYMDVYPDMELFLLDVGRRKFLELIYVTLEQHSEESRAWARVVYGNARDNYHSISRNTIDEILRYNPEDDTFYEHPSYINTEEYEFPQDSTLNIDSSEIIKD